MTANSSVGNYATNKFGWDTNHNQWRTAMLDNCNNVGYSNIPWSSYQGQISSIREMPQQRQILPQPSRDNGQTMVAPFWPCNMMTSQDYLEAIRGNQRAKKNSILLPGHYSANTHTTSYSLQQKRNRSQNPLLCAKIKQKQQCPILNPALVPTPVGCVHLQSCHGCQSLYIYAGGQPQIGIGTIPDQSDTIRKLERENALKSQLNNSVPFKKRKLAKRRANAIHKKKLKRLQKENRPYTRFRYELWKTVNQEKGDLKRNRIITMRNRRMKRTGCISRMSSPEECALWNCPKKLLRKGRFNRRYVNSSGSMASLNMGQRSRSRTPIVRLRDTPLPGEN